MVAAPTPKRFTVVEYQRLGELGFFHEDDRIELLDGEIIEMAAVGGEHAAIVRILTDLVARQIGDGVLLDVQNPLRLNDDSMPQPDLALVMDELPRRGTFRCRRPAGDGIGRFVARIRL